MSFFSAPVEGRLKDLNTRLNSELGAVAKLTSQKAEVRRRKIHSLKLKAAICERDVRDGMRKFLACPIAGSVLNVISLILFSLWADEQISGPWFAFAIFQTVLLYPVIFGGLKLYAMAIIQPVEDDIKAELEASRPL